MNPELLVTSLDFDGCSDNEHSHQRIIDNILKTCAQFPSINKIIVMVGSLRQTLFLDLLNAFMNEEDGRPLSCEILYSQFLPNLEKQIQHRLGGQIREIEFSPFLLNDVYNQLPTGETFKAIQDIFSRPLEEINIYREDDKAHLVTNIHGTSINIASQDESFHMADCSKHSIIYAQAQFIKLAHPEYNVLFQFYDDRLDILGGLYKFFSSTTIEYPHGCTLELIHHESTIGFIPIRYREQIHGTGALNPSYHEHIFMMGMAHSWKGIEVENPIFKFLLDCVKERNIGFKHHHPYIGLKANVSISAPSPIISVAVAAAPVIQQESIDYSIFTYLNDNKPLFNLAYKLEKERRLGTSCRYWVIHAEFEALLELYSEDHFPGMREELTEYGECRCDKEQEAIPLLAPKPRRFAPISIFNTQQNEEVDAPKSSKECPF